MMDDNRKYLNEHRTQSCDIFHRSDQEGGVKAPELKKRMRKAAKIPL